MSTYQTYVYRYDEATDTESETEVLVEFDYSAGMPAPRSKYGPPESPDDDEELNINEVTTLDGKEFEVTKAEMDSLEEKVWEHIRDEQSEPSYEED